MKCRFNSDEECRPAPPSGGLLDLLVTIHRDGGHYVEEHGLDKAIQDAVVAVDNMKFGPPSEGLTRALAEEIYDRMIGHLCEEAQLPEVRETTVVGIAAILARVPVQS